MHQNMNAICAVPATRIAHDTRCTRTDSSISPQKASEASAPIQNTFRRHGISDAAANRPIALRTPIPNAAPQMKIMYGRRMRVSFSIRIARGVVAASSPSAAVMPHTPSATAAPSIRRDIDITARASRRALSMFSVASSPLKIGTKAAVSAPSPNSLRAMFGIANASVNALCSQPAPMKRLCSISRARPSTRESAVIAPTTAVFFRMPPALTISRLLH